MTFLLNIYKIYKFKYRLKYIFINISIFVRKIIKNLILRIFISNMKLNAKILLLGN